MCIYAERAGNVVLFHHEGGVDIGDVDAKAKALHLDIEDKLPAARIKSELLGQVPAERQECVDSFSGGQGPAQSC